MIDFGMSARKKGSKRRDDTLSRYRRIRTPMPPPERVILDRRRELEDEEARREIEEEQPRRDAEEGDSRGAKERP